MNKLLHVKEQKKLRTCDVSSQLADAFADFVSDKISKISDGLHTKWSDVINHFPGHAATPMASLDEFQPVTPQELSDIILGTKVKSCQLDPLPAVVLKKCLDTLLPVLTKMVNLSLSHGMPECMKEALLDPLLK